LGTTIHKISIANQGSMSCCTARRVSVTCLPARATSASSWVAEPWLGAQSRRICGGKSKRSLWPDSDGSRNFCLRCPRPISIQAQHQY